MSEYPFSSPDLGLAQSQSKGSQLIDPVCQTCTSLTFYRRHAARVLLGVLPVIQFAL